MHILFSCHAFYKAYDEKPTKGIQMLFIKVVPENYDKIVARCKDLNYEFLKEHEEDARLIDDPPYYATPWWTSKFGKTYSWSVLFREDTLDEEMDFPHGKSDTNWFQATRKKS